MATIFMATADMKLRQICENLMMQQLRSQLLHSGPYFAKPMLQVDSLYNPYSGHDSGSGASGSSFLGTQTPSKPRNRRFLGMEKRLGVIRL